MKRILILSLSLISFSALATQTYYVWVPPNSDARVYSSYFTGEFTFLDGMYRQFTSYPLSSGWRLVSQDVFWYFRYWKVVVNGQPYEPWDATQLPPEFKEEKTRPDESTTEPIDTHTGNNYFTENRLYVPCLGIPLALNLKYQSVSSQPEGALGKGWRHNYEWFLDVKENYASIYTGSGEKYTFQNFGGTYQSPASVSWKLLTNASGYEMRQPVGIVYHFATNGQLSAIRDTWGNRQDCSYDTSNCLITVTHSNGRQIVFSNQWDSAISKWRVSSVHVPDGPAVAFTYNGDGQLTQMLEQAGAECFTSSYAYADGYLTNKIDKAGSPYTFSYETGTNGLLNGKGTFLSASGWYEHTVSYISSNTTDVSYSARGQDQIFRYFRNSNDTLNAKYGPAVSTQAIERLGTRFTYAANGSDKTGETLFDNSTGATWSDWMQYDGAHNITNFSSAYCSTAPVQRVSIAYDSVWNLPSAVTDAEGHRTEMVYTNGAIARSRIYLSSNTTVETAYGYTTNGLLSAVTNANGHSIAFTYDTRGYPQAVIPQVGPTVAFGYDSLGHLTNSALPGGRQTGYTVNPLGWVERIETADGLYETFRYDGLGKVTNQVDRAGRVASYTYAPGGKLTAVSRQLGGTSVTVSYAFDQQFNTLAIRDELNRPVESYALDPQDRPTTVTNLEGQVMSIRYLVGDFVDSITRFDGTVVSNQYTGDGRLAAVRYPGETNQFAYLRNGLVRTLENSKGSISNAWNSASWLTKTVSSASSVTSAVNYAYDLVGNVTNSVVDLGGSRSVATAYQYDQAERLQEIFTTEGAETQRFVYAYNPDNGLVASVSNGNLRAEYQYDIMNRITSIDWKNAWGATILSFDYQYNAAGMITNVVKNDGLQLSVKSYQYDDLDRLTGEASFAGSAPLRENSYSYDAAGNRLSKQNFDSTVSYTLGAGNRLASWSATSANNFLSARTMRVQGHSSEPIGTDSRWGQLYVSNTVAVVPNVNGTNFWVNSFVTGLGTQKVVAAIRDQAGNVGYATNEIFLTVVTNGAYQYNVAGCVTNIAYTGADYAQTTKLGWDSQYRLTSASSVTSAVNYSYNVLGRRIGRTEGTNVEHHVYDGNQVVVDLNENGAVIRSYTWGPGIDNLLAMTVYTSSGTNTYYALKDHLNSIHALVNESGSVVESYEYDAWGRVLDMKDASGNSIANHQSAIGNRYLWQGREYDSATGLYYFRARWYDPGAGRWLSKDPIGISGGLNMYVFCGNNPVNFVDPMGNFGHWFGDHDGVIDIGRRGTLISDQPGQAGEILEKYLLPAGETFGQSHDAFVGFMVPDVGNGIVATVVEKSIDTVVNIPSMPIIYGGAVVAETARSGVGIVGGIAGAGYNAGKSVAGFFGSAFNALKGGNSCGGKK